MPPDEETSQESVEELYLGSDAIDLVERIGGESKTIPIKLIQPGWGSSGYYPAAVLAKDGPNAWKAGTHMYFDHPTESESKERPERSVRDLAGVIVSDPVYEEHGKAGPGLYAKASILPQYRPLIEQLAPHIGVSIRAHGTFAPGEVDGKKGRIIERIDSGESVDFVTKPGAGGKVLAMWESLKLPTATTSNVMTETTTSASGTGTVWIDSGTTAHPTTVTTPGITITTAEPISEVKSMELKEAQERVTALEGELAEAKKQAAETLTRADRAETALAILEAQSLVAKELANVSLPNACKDRIVNEVAANPPMAEGKLDEAAIKALVEEKAAAEAKYIESILGSGKITGQGTKQDAEPDPKATQESLTKHMGSFFRLDESTAKLAAQGR